MGFRMVHHIEPINQPTTSHTFLILTSTYHHNMLSQCFDNRELAFPKLSEDTGQVAC